MEKPLIKFYVNPGERTISEKRLSDHVYFGSFRKEQMDEFCQKHNYSYYVQESLNQITI